MEALGGRGQHCTLYGSNIEQQGRVLSLNKRMYNDGSNAINARD